MKRIVKNPKTKSKLDIRIVRNAANKVTKKRKQDYRERDLIYQDGIFYYVGVDSILNI